jgi:hypothetical protein
MANQLVADFRETAKGSSEYVLAGQVLANGTVVLDGIKLTYSGLRLSTWEPWELVPDVREYLRAHGCTDIQYEFYQE